MAVELAPELAKGSAVDEQTDKQVETNMTVACTESKGDAQVPIESEAPELSPEQVLGAVSALFRAHKFSKEKDESSGLFDDEPEMIALLISSIKIPRTDTKLMKVRLPHPMHNKESDICLIVKDLQKGWKENHEPTTQHYQELLSSKGVDFINEIIPLRQLRVEYKPFESKSKLSRRFDVLLADRRIIKFVPRYLGKSFYHSARIPLSVDVDGVENLSQEMEKVLSFTTMSVTNNGASFQMNVGLTSQEENHVVANVMKAYKDLSVKFPGGFRNIRSLTLRVGTCAWTVPIYVSYAERSSVKMPASSKRSAPVVGELTTLKKGFKVAVYPSGDVKVVASDGKAMTAKEAKATRRKAAKKAKKKRTAKNGESEDEGEDISDLDELSDDDVDVADEAEAGAVVAGGEKKTAAQDSSDDEAVEEMEDEYIRQLEEEEQGAQELAAAEKEAEAAAPPKKKARNTKAKQVAKNTASSSAPAKKTKKN